MKQELRAELEADLASCIVSLKPVSGGSICESYLLETESDRLFLKCKPGAPAGFFEAEADGLRQLREAAEGTGIIVPRVVKPSPRFLLLEYLESGASDSKSFAQSLAALHSRTAERFGAERSNFIGTSTQAGGLSDDWGEFFCEKRLGVQIEALSAQIESSLLAGFGKIRSRLAQFLNEHEPEPVLVHGDLWSGNLYWSSEGPALIDPAVYWADYEVDIAFTEMFGGFGADFYREYGRIKKLPSEERIEVYNLYHLLNHAQIFGGGYLSSAQVKLASVIRQFS